MAILPSARYGSLCDISRWILLFFGSGGRRHAPVKARLLLELAVSHSKGTDTRRGGRRAGVYVLSTSLAGTRCAPAWPRFSRSARQDWSRRAVLRRHPRDREARTATRPSHGTTSARQTRGRTAAIRRCGATPSPTAIACRCGS